MSNPPIPKPFADISWSAFLGVSWTWCIGMFLPVLLVRDLGTGGFLVFAIPNVIGAAAMGTVLRNSESSRIFLARHRGACAAFSVVTIFFHLFFLVWATTTFLFVSSGALIAFVPLVACLFLLFHSNRPAVAIAWIVLLISLAIFGGLAIRFPHAASDLHMAGRLSSINLLGLASVCVLGFLTCPYLDLTFHHVRQATSARGGEIAFQFGFGACFASMILFALWYAMPLQSLSASQIDHRISRLVGLHILLQSAFTIAAHLRALQRNWAATAMLGTVAAVIASFLVPFVASLLPLHLPGGSGEEIYRLFMGFYGLIFPAYLWICMKGVPRRSIAVFAITVVACAPMFWLGFMEEKMLWLIPGVALLLLARLLTSADPLQAAGTAAPIVSQHVGTTDAR